MLHNQRFLYGVPVMDEMTNCIHPEDICYCVEKRVVFSHIHNLLDRIHFNFQMRTF